MLTKEELVEQLVKEGFPVQITEQVVVLSPEGDAEAFLQRLLDFDYHRSFGYSGSTPKTERLEAQILGLQLGD